MKVKILNESGAALVVALLTMTLLTLLGVAAINTSSTDILISRNYKTSTQALATAEAGVQEVISRMSMRNDSSVSIANGGSQVSPAVNGISNAYIGDSIASPTANWETRIFFTSSDPTDDSVNNIVNTSSLLPSSEWDNLNYTETSTTNGTSALCVRHEIESDLGVDLNSDGDQTDLVYYDKETGRNATGTGYIVELITSTGRRGDARRTVVVEACRYLLSVDPKAAVAVGRPPDFTGSAFISGFDHLENTTSSDDTAGAFGAIQDDAVDSYGGTGADDSTATLDEPAPPVDYAGQLTGNIANYLPGAASNGQNISLGGSMKVFGGNDSVPWKDEALPAWQTLAELLGITNNELTHILSQATATEADIHTSGHLDKAPQGIIYINNPALGDEVKINSSTPSYNNGFGLMYITGDADFQKCTFRGLIYVEGDVRITGTFWLLGALVNQGRVTGDFSAGNGTFLYSSAVLENMNQYMGYSILSWREE
ncbi:MAG: pilus assembly PilX N-terminal domain-containing protein [Thermodesulfobacteriota bacterium]|nr:pilus assembly PilX N-terminal domain-containing protein [Thermodesulfobacteriota bacterium]